MSITERLKSAIGNEYLLNTKQRQELVAGLKDKTCLYREKPQPHTNKIVKLK